MKKKNILIIVIFVFLIMFSIVVFKGIQEKGPTTTNETCEVKFYDHKNKVIKSEKVKVGENATSPIYKFEHQDQVFIGWSKSFNNVESDLEIFPVLEDISGEKNVIYSSYSCSNGEDTIQVPFQIRGEVNFCCLELEIDYDDKYLEFIETTEVDGDGLVNLYNGKIYLVFACSENVSGSVDLMTLKFKVLKNNTKDNDLINITVADIASFDSNNQFLDEESKVIMGDIILN